MGGSKPSQVLSLVVYSGTWHTIHPVTLHVSIQAHVPGRFHGICVCHGYCIHMGFLSHTDVSGFLMCIAPDACKASTTLTAPSGVIERGVHAFGSIPLQTYGPGETCKWVIAVPNAKTLTLTFKSVATGYDQLDHIDVFQGGVLQKRINGAFISAVVVKLNGNQALVQWTSFGLRSPFPDATGFYMTYSSTWSQPAGCHCALISLGDRSSD